VENIAKTRNCAISVQATVQQKTAENKLNNGALHIKSGH